MELAPRVRHALCRSHALFDAAGIATESVRHKRAFPGLVRFKLEEVTHVFAASGFAELKHHRLDRVGTGCAV